MSKTSTERVLEMRKRDKALGRKRKEYPVTDDEHEYLVAKLAEYRASKAGGVS